jgi:ribonuclease D
VTAPAAFSFNGFDMSLINSPEALADVVESARRADAVAIDTEFVWERTYYPRLGLVQVGLGPEEVYLLDAPALDLSPLGAVLADASVTKIVHDAVQDLTILRRATGADPRNVFDTQLAAGFIGLGASISLQNLLGELAGVRLDKGATRSDWLQRPLTKAQLSYAADDVRYMVAAYREMQARLAARGREAWAAEEMAHLNDAERFQEDDPRERYRSVRGRGRKGFSGRDYAVLRELAAWREEVARNQDRPRGHILDDSLLIEIALRKPTTEEKLRGLRGISDRDVARHGEALLAAVQAGVDAPRESWPERNGRPNEDVTQTPRLDLVQAFIRGRGEREGVDPVLVANRADVERLVALPPDRLREHPVLHGWRREFIGADLEDLLTGRAALSIDQDGLPAIVRIPETTA